MSIPKHIRQRFGSSRQFKAVKRSEVRAVLRAMDDLSFGSAYMPPDAFAEFLEARRKMRSVLKRISVKNWGR